MTDCLPETGRAALRVVLDTNVWLDWLVFADTGIQALREAVTAGIAQIYIDAECERELERVLAYRLRRTTLSTGTQAAYIADCRRLARRVAGVAANPLPSCRDRDDQKFLALADACEAHFLLTKDKALLELAPHPRVRFRIIPPGEFPPPRA